MKKKTVLKILAEVGAILLCLIWISPLALVVINCAKNTASIVLDPIALPADWGQIVTNFIKVWTDRTVQYSKAFKSSVIITFGSLLFIDIFASMAAWAIVRSKSRISNLVYTIFIASMVIPFQVIMYPLVSWFRTLSTSVTLPLFGFSMLRSYPGMIFAYIGFGMSMSVFLFSGFVKSIPYEVEEAATVDGCSKLQIYTKIILPMLRPIMVTVTILNGIWIWNDYMLPFLVLGKGNKIQTLPLAVSNFVGAYTKQWDMILCSAFLAIVPVLIFFLLAQKQIMKGMVEGAVKS
ncbi:MAG: carbohydrate ABC transporter permease [Erysipelotrichaceae bacterium]